MRRTVLVILAALAVAACTPAAEPSPQPTASATEVPSPIPLASDAVAEPGTTPFPTPGPTITPGSTRVIGTIVHPDGSPARGVCVVLEKGICPIATDEQGVWFTDIPAGPITWNFIYKIDGQDAGRQSVAGSSGGELRLPVFVLDG
jgi:hypothetical protein